MTTDTALILVTVLLAVLSVELEDLLHSVLCLGGMCITIGALYGFLDAHYVMVFQFLIYAGATLILFASVIMFTEREED